MPATNDPQPSFGERFRSGQSLNGFQLTSVSPHWPRQLAGKIDFIFIDCEHHCFSREQVAFLCGMYRASGIVPIVRVLEPRGALVRAAIDDGAGGIVAPYVESIQQVRQLVAATKLRPIQGERAEAAMQDQALDQNLQTMVDRHCGGMPLILQIESEIAVDRCSQLTDIAGVDGVLVGGFDLTATLGCLSDHADPRFITAITNVASICRDKGIGAGIYFAESPAKERWAKRLGYNLMIQGCDVSLIRDAIAMRHQQSGESSDPPSSHASSSL